ncbi:MAG TPA: Calx-beta domain-containing protein [Pyrinomonadaceae bacterium]
MKAAVSPSARRNPGSLKSVCLALAASLVALSAAGVVAVLAADQFFAGDGSALNASRWGATAAGPFTGAFTSGGVANFAAPNGTGTGASITVGGVNATENFTLTAAGGTVSNQGNGVVPVGVSAGKTLDFGAQVFTSSAAAGYVKNGAGVLAFAGGTYGGGFTLNSGTVIARGVNAFGGNVASPGPLNVNGGAVGASLSRDFSDKYSAINLGGDFQLGVPASAVPVSSDAANLTFNSSVALGAATRTVTVGANGTYTLGGVVSGGSGVGLTVARLPNATGRLVLSGANTYTGQTTVGGGTLALVGSGSIANSSAVELAGGSIFDVSGLTTALTLSSGQALKAGGTTQAATVATAAGKGLNTAPDSPLQFTAFGGVTPPLTVTGAGAVTLSGTNPVAVTVSNGGSPLGAGDYTLIAKGAGSGGVAGTVPASLTIGGDGVAAGAAASLLITGQQLILRVAPAVSVGDVTLPEPAAPAGGTTLSYAQFPVTLSEVMAVSVTVSYATADGTASVPGDYTALSGTLTFAPGETRKTVAVAVKSDALSESPETFSLTLSAPSGAAVADAAGVATITAPSAAGTVVISEFRLRGPEGAGDEFVEIYNNTDTDITVTDANFPACSLQLITAGPTTPCGWALLDLQGAASTTPIPRFVVPVGTIIPARGHYLAAGTGYSLSALASPDLTYDPPGYGDADFTGLALYKTADRAQFTQANAFDAVGFDGVGAAFREGTGLLPADGVTADAEHAFVRNQGSGRPADTGDNRADFTLVSNDPALITDGTATLGAPGPENRTGPVSRNSKFTVAVPPGVASSLRAASPAVTNGDLGTLSLRRRFTNNTGQALNRLRFRVTDVQTFRGRLIYGTQAELRLLDAQLTGLSGTGLKAATVEAAPTHPLGGGVNTSLVIGGSLTLTQPLQNGQSVDVEFLLGVMKGGSYQFILVVEAAP